jgi:tetratricopeptide (TPR) repeat protein
MRLRWLSLWLLVGVAGCSGFLGRYYLENERYDDGIRHFEQQVQSRPDDSEANYFLGRLLLAREDSEPALQYLRRAVELAQDRPDYYFWQGVAYWAVRDFAHERASYQRALELAPDHLPARLYLGHAMLDSGQWADALAQYQAILSRDPRNPEALYNSGLALRGLSRVVEEARAWKAYLTHYPEGRWAIQAVDHLNGLGDFSYRNFMIGYRRVTLEQIPFAPGSVRLLAAGEPSLDVVGAILSINQDIDLEIVCHKAGDAALAGRRAEAVLAYLLRHFPSIRPSRLTAREIGNPETVETERGGYHLDESIVFVTVKQ